MLLKAWGFESPFSYQTLVKDMKNYDIVILSGGFDPPHVGHVRMIMDAAERGEKVIVGVNSDNWLTRKKGYVFMRFEERVELVQSVKGVYEAVGFNDDDNTASDLIEKVREQYPDLKIAFGNGGDRIRENTPEMKTCLKEQVDMIWQIGGEDKVQSSSKLVESSKK